MVSFYRELRADLETAWKDFLGKKLWWKVLHFKQNQLQRVGKGFTSFDSDISVSEKRNLQTKIENVWDWRKNFEKKLE